jgi:hypothetical protein
MIYLIKADYFAGLLWLFVGVVVDAGGTAVGRVGIAFGSTVFFNLLFNSGTA